MFKWFNSNTHELSEKDCVCRAISTALRIPFDVTARLLDLVADRWQCPTLCVCCYRHLLEDVFGMTPIDAAGQTVGGIASTHLRDVVIVRIEGHLTVSVGGVVLDTWDCRGEVADCFWVCL